MFTPIILVCAMNICTTIGGPSVATEGDCHRSVVEMGIPYVTQAYPNYQIVDYKCVSWGAPT